MQVNKTFDLRSNQFKTLHQGKFLHKVDGNVKHSLFASESIRVSDDIIHYRLPFLLSLFF